MTHLLLELLKLVILLLAVVLNLLLSFASSVLYSLCAIYSSQGWML